MDQIYSQESNKLNQPNCSRDPNWASWRVSALQIAIGEATVEIEGRLSPVASFEDMDATSHGN